MLTRTWLAAARRRSGRARGGARFRLPLRPRLRGALALVVSVMSVIVLVTPLPAAPAALQPSTGAAAPAAYQVTLNVGTGIQYSLYQGEKVDLPVTITVTGGAALATATVLVQYDPVELRPTSCVHQQGGPGGYCNIAWSTGLVRLNILSGDGVLGSNLSLFTLTFEPAATATINRTSSVTPQLESIADVYGNYMTSWLVGSTVKVLKSTAPGTAVYVGGETTKNPILITRGTTISIPIEVARVNNLVSASFALSFDPTVVRALECQPVAPTPMPGMDASGACALFSDHVNANLMSSTGITGTFKAFTVTFTTAPAASPPAKAPLTLTLGAFADNNDVPITPVRIYNVDIQIDKSASEVVPILRMTPVEQYLLDDARVTVDVYLDNGSALVSGGWGIRYDSTIVQAEACTIVASGMCNPTGEAGLARMSVLRDVLENQPFPAKIATLTFRRHPQAKASQRATLTFEVTDFADAAEEQITYQAQSASIVIDGPLGTPAAVAMNLVGTPPYLLAKGDYHDFPIRFVVDRARPIVNLSGSIHYDPKVLRPTRCIRYDGGTWPSGFCNSETEQDTGIIRFNLLADSEDVPISGDFTPFVFRVEPASLSKNGDNSPLHFTIEAITGPAGVPRTWAATDEAVNVKVPIPAPRVVAGSPNVTATAIYTVPLGYTTTVPVSVDNVPDLGAGTVEIRYDNKVGRATSCTLRSDLTPALDGGFCSLLPGVVRAAFVSSGGIDGDAHVFDIVFSQAPNVIGGETTPLHVVVDNFVDTQEVPIPTAPYDGQLDISCYAEPVDDLHIARDGNNLLLTWTHKGTATSGYQVWRANENAYFLFGDTWSTNIGTVAAPAGGPGAAVGYTDVSGYVDPILGTVGPWADNLNHYYMVRSMCGINQGSLRSNRVGKFTRPLAPGWNMVAWPLLVYDETLDAVLARQLFGTNDPDTADRVQVWHTDTQRYEEAWYCGGPCGELGEPWAYHWLADSWAHSSLLLGPDVGFWIHNRSGAPEVVKIVGAVAEQPVTLSLGPGWNLLGNRFSPLPSGDPIGTAGLVPTGTNDPDTADRVQVWHEDTQRYEEAWYCGGECDDLGEPWARHWLADSWAHSDLVLGEPGYGFWYHNRHAATIWINRRE